MEIINPSSGFPLVNFGDKRIAFGSPASFVPTQLSGLNLWYDISDLSAMWTTSGKTTQVASDGDPVGYIEDKSGNGLDASIKSQTEGQTEIKTLLNCLQKDIGKLNDDKLLKQGYDDAIQRTSDWDNYFWGKFVNGPELDVVVAE